MKWFKHDTDCDESEGLNALLDQTGWAGYGRWFRILEIVALKMDKTDKCSATFPSKHWQRKLGFYHHKALKDYLDITARLMAISVQSSSNVGSMSGQCSTDLTSMLRESSNDLITISIPNLLKKRDEYSKKSGQAPDNVPPKREEVRSKKEDTDIRIKEKEDIASSAKPPKPPTTKKLPDDIWIRELTENIAYQGIDINKELGKCVEWFKNKNKIVSRQRFLNWLNRIEQPLQGGNGNGRSGNNGKDQGKDSGKPAEEDKYADVGEVIDLDGSPE